MTVSMLVRKREMIYTEAPADTILNCQVVATNFWLWSFILSPSELKRKSSVQDSPCCITYKGVIGICIPEVQNISVALPARGCTTKVVWNGLLSCRVFVYVNVYIIFYMTFKKSQSNFSLRSKPPSLTWNSENNPGYMSESCWWQ